jgi:hypothetical protein
MQLQELGELGTRGRELGDRNVFTYCLKRPVSVHDDWTFSKWEKLPARLQFPQRGDGTQIRVTLNS